MLWLIARTTFRNVMVGFGLIFLIKAVQQVAHWSTGEIWMGM